MKIPKISKILKIFDDSQKLEISEVFNHVNSTQVEKEFP
jgi:hypothetical protein